MPYIKRCLLSLAVVLLMLCQVAFAADFSNLIILHTNDTHGFDIYGDGHNGLAVIAQVKKDLESQGYQVLLLDAGDVIQDNNLVNFSKGKSGIAMYNAAGYDAGTLGNHEFDYGQDVLAERISEAKYPIVSSNVIVEATGKPLVPPTAVFDKGDIRIGVVGLITPETIVSTSPKNVKGLRFLEGQELYANTQKHVNELRNQGCELIIALGHMGSEESCMGNRSEDILNNVKGIDIFVDGHDHRVKNEYINGALQVETGSYTKNIGHIVYKNGKWTEELIPFGVYTKQEPQVEKVAAVYQAEVDEALSKVLGQSQVELTGQREPGVRTMETNSGDFMADAYLWQATQANVLKGKVDGAIVNGGNIRKGLPRGEVKRGDIVSAAPYNNQLYVVAIKGSKLLEILECGTCVIPEAMGAFPQVAGIEYALDTTVPFAKGEQYPNSPYFAPAQPGSRVTIKTVGGKSFDKEAVYVIAMAEFLTQGGDSYAGLLGQGAIIEKQSTGYVDAEAIENYLCSALNGVIDQSYAQPQGRILIK